MIIEYNQPGVPVFECSEYAPKLCDYAVLIPIINEGERIINCLLYTSDAADD